MNQVVSICIPVYNGMHTIKDTLDCVLKQSYKNMEIIVVDNCSEDDTVDIVRSFQDDRIRLYINESNIGMAGNWNKCLEYVQGEYIQFVCADDIILPKCIEKKTKMLDEYDDMYMVFGASAIIDASGKVSMTRHEYRKDCVVDGKKLAKHSYHIKNLYGEPTNVMFRASAIPKVGNFVLDSYYATDWDMWLRLSSLGLVGYIDEELMHYRVTSSNQTSKIKFSKFLEDDKIMMQNVDRYQCIDITIMDKLIHRLMYVIRLIARTAYMKLFIK